MIGVYLMFVVGVVCFSGALVRMIRAEIAAPRISEPRQSHRVGVK